MESSKHSREDLNNFEERQPRKEGQSRKKILAAEHPIEESHRGEQTDEVALKDVRESLAQIKKELIISPEKSETEQFRLLANIELGSGPRTPDEFKQALKEAGVSITEGVDYALGHMDITDERKMLKLVWATPEELGILERETSFRKIAQKARENGLGLIPSEAVPRALLSKELKMGAGVLHSFIGGMEPTPCGRRMMGLFDRHARFYVGEYGKKLNLTSNLITHFQQNQAFVWQELKPETSDQKIGDK